MRAKLFILLSCFTVLAGCAGYDDMFCRSDYCTYTSYMPNAYSNNADYSCGHIGGGDCLNHNSNSCGVGGGGSCGMGGTNCTSYGCRENVWDNPGSLEGN